jgi:pimeloyl-ACP methyl ester carboxylesterase
MPAPFEIDFDDALIRGETDGLGVPVIFLHAGVTDRRMWAGQMKLLAAEGYNVISYDRRGYGETESPDVPFNHVVDLEAVMDQLGINAAILVGSSMGGGIAIDFALQNPHRTIALVLVGTAVTGADDAEIPEEASALEDALSYAVERGNLDRVNQIEAHIWLDGALSEPGRVDGPPRELFLEMNAVHLRHPELTEEETPDDAMSMVGAISAPVLLLVGELDLPDIKARHEELSETLENAFALTIEDTAHFPNMERPDLFDPLLSEFLAAVTGQSDLGDEDDED